MKERAFAEVIESSLGSCKGQTWQWDTVPPFGSLVLIKEHETTQFGIVTALQTLSENTNYAPFTYQKTQEELLKEQPHIFDFLHTRFTVTLVAFAKNNTLFYQITPVPPKMHAFITMPTTQEVTYFFTKADYLYPLLESNLTNKDELIIALLQQQKELALLSKERLFEILDILLYLEQDAYQKIALLIKRMRLQY